MFSFDNKFNLHGHKDSINALAIEGKILFSGSDDLTICLWDCLNQVQLMQYKAHTMGIKSLMIIEESGHLVSCAFDGLIKVWDYV